MDTGRFRPVVFSMEVANPKRVDQQQLSLNKEQPEPKLSTSSQS